MQSQKGPKKVTKIYANRVGNLGTKKDLQNVVTLLKGQSMFTFVFFYLGVVFNYMQNYKLGFPGGSVEVNPLLLKIARQSKRQESMAVEKREVVVMNQSWMMLRCKMSKLL